MKPDLRHRTRRLGRATLWLSVVAMLVGAGASGLVFTGSKMDLVLIQLVFYGAWSALLGGWAGGLLGAAVEEDACGDMDMGVTSSMGAFVGAIAFSLAADAAVGLALYGYWMQVLIGAGLATSLVAAVEILDVRIRRKPGFDSRGLRVDAEGEPLPDTMQPLRMRDRFTLLVTASVLTMIGLIAFMAVKMGSDLGSSVMLAPMSYAMSGGMLGGILGGWIAGLRDEHVGSPRHENAVMVGGMALMSGMMGAMPASMVAGMMAVMGKACIEVTVVSGLALALATVALVMRGRYRFGRGQAPLSPEQPCGRC